MGKIETKVIAGAAGSGLGAALGTFLLWLLAVLVWHAPATADGADKALATIPGPVSGLVVILVSIAGALFGGYAAPHTPRPDLGEPDLTAVQNVFNAAPVESSPAVPSPAEPEAPAAGVPPASTSPSAALVSTEPSLP